jgi:hypothetical protein
MSLQNYQNQLDIIDNKIINLIEKRYIINNILKKLIKKKNIDLNKFNNKLKSKKITKINIIKLTEILNG